MNRSMLSRTYLPAILLGVISPLVTACSDGPSPMAPPAPLPTPTDAALARGRTTPRIYFESDRDTPGFFDIYSMNGDGTDVRRLTGAPGQDQPGPVSPDGTRLLFTSDRDDPKGDIYVMNVDGTGVTRLTFGGGLDGGPSWSKDGKRILFHSVRAALDPANAWYPDYDIYVMNADGSQLTRLTTGGGYDGEPAWSPDGKRIAFVSGRANPTGGTVEIYVMNIDGSNVQRLTSFNRVADAPAWSPDGRRIAFQTYLAGTAPAVWVMNDDGTQQTQITATNTLNVTPQWTDTGDQIVFMSSRDGNAEIYLMNPDGSSAVRVTNNAAADGTPYWHR